MKNDFTIRLKTKDFPKQETFRGLLAKVNISFQLLCTKSRYEDGKGYHDMDTYYLINTEPHALIEVKKMIDAEIEYEVLELFEYVSW